MTELAISTAGLRKSYRTLRGRRVAVDSLDLAVPRGGVHGFLGPNGSGKTTTIRMLLGLVRPDRGQMTILGRAVPRRLPEVIGQVGAVVERPRFFPNFSARLNLELAADAAGVPRARVGRVLDQVGLTERAKDPYRTYSLGMQQRLAVAATLLKDPELLIFDEPTNGLDPSGIHEVRETIRSLGREGRTVLVSSHILSEVEQMADTVSIVGKGRLLTSGSVVDLLGARASRMRIQVDDSTRAAQLLVQQGLAVIPEGTALLVEGSGDPARITRLLADEGLYLRELVSVRRDLEAVYLELTRKQGLEPTVGPGIELPPLLPSQRRRDDIVARSTESRPTGSRITEARPADEEN
ncbi:MULTISPECIES: ABC transporter ATP-binding protein [unclassified Luteococcus]|uniref:ABC transporter ATP-binding protein n=1 Tax=unclassified Luteococcus TaxID=2639923 RepID=UPI00313D1444